MRNRDELCKELGRHLHNITNDRKKIRQIQERLVFKFSIPIGVTNDYLTLRKDITDAEDFVLYIFADEILPSKVETYFTANELKVFEKSKYKVSSLKFPLRFKMVQISDDQWIGKITVRELIKLRDAQVINYNQHTQRTMERVMSNGVEHYRIALNHRAVDAIVQSFKNNTYIANTITFNLPLDADYYYDEDAGELVINKSDNFQFDIIDGYHRYFAISKIYNANKKFDYDMELRIVQFVENRAKQFIWQEDQKTKMRRVDSESLNQIAAPNKIMARLNVDPSFNLVGKISPNEGVINSGEFYLCLNTLYRDEFKKRNEMATVARLTEYYKNFINKLTDQDNSFTQKWDRKTTIAVTYAAYKETPETEVVKRVNEYRRVLGEHSELFSKYQNNAMNKKDFSRLDKLLAEEAR